MEAKLYCEQPDSKDTLEMIEVGKCLNNNVAKWGKCMDDSAYKFAMIKFAPKDVRVPHVCWYVHTPHVPNRILFL